MECYGWRKGGLINDIILSGNNIKDTGDNKVISQEISTHVVHIHPSKKDYLDLSTIQGRSIDKLKLEFLHYKYVIAINKNVEMSL